jgi:hypothetical protein
VSKPISRRAALKIVGIAGTSALGGSLVTTAVAMRPEQAVAAEESDFAFRFFTPHEWRTVRVLVDDIIPRDERSGSATDAKVPEFMDSVLLDDEVTPPLSRIEMRGGIAWMDRECRRRFARDFADCTEDQRHQLLDDIAFPKKARAEMGHGADFFGKMRDFTAAGFFSSAIGYQDLEVQGNVFVPEWKGCPEAALKRLGVSYASFDARYRNAESP